MYQENNAYAFDLFEEHERVASSVQSRNREKQAVLPKTQEPEKAPTIKKVKPKTKNQKRIEARHTNLKALLIMVFMGIVFCAACSHINSAAKHHELTAQIAAVEAQIENAKSENIRLNAELNGITSIGKIDSYATKILGMTKLEKYQVECINLSVGDKVLFSAAKSTASDKAADETVAAVPNNETVEATPEQESQTNENN